MKNVKLITLYAMCSIAVLSSCKKDKDDAPAPTTTPAPAPAPTKTQLLTGKNWDKISTILTVEGRSLENPERDCDKDDIERYSAASATATSGDLVLDPKAIKCDADDEIVTLPWSFNAAQTEIIWGIAGAEESIVYKIIELTSTTLKLGLSGKTTDGSDYKTTITYSAK